MMSGEELSPELLRRTMIAMVTDDVYDTLEGSYRDGVFRLSVMCSDFFTWGCADAEPVQTEDDVKLLEQCRGDLDAVNDAKPHGPLWIGELYAARKRNAAPARFMTDPAAYDGRYYMGADVVALFPSAAVSS